MQNKVSDEHLFIEVSDLLRTTPSIEEIKEHTPAILGWLGRVSAALHQWNMVTATTTADIPINHLLNGGANATVVSYRQVNLLLHRAQNDLRMKTTGPANEFIEASKPFEYFDTVRQIIEEANSEVFFIDPYLDADFVSKYLPYVKSGVKIKLLTSNKIPQLIPAVRTFCDQHNADIVVRKKAGLHDRYVIIDEVACYQSGASFKDGAKKSPVVLNQITDIFADLHKSYAGFWESGSVEYPVNESK